MQKMSFVRAPPTRTKVHARRGQFRAFLKSCWRRPGGVSGRGQIERFQGCFCCFGAKLNFGRSIGGAKLDLSQEEFSGV